MMPTVAEPGSPRRYRFAEFEFRTRTGELLRRGQDLKLPEQAGKVLFALLRASGEVVTRDELRQVLWPGKSYGDFEGGINAAVRKLRLVMADEGMEPRLVGTLPKRGYRLLVPSECMEEESADFASPLPAMSEDVPSARSLRWRDGLFQSTPGRKCPPLQHGVGEPAALQSQIANRHVTFRRNRFLWSLGVSLLVLGAGGAIFLKYRQPGTGAVRIVMLSGGVPLELVRIPAGEFAMGFDSGFKASEPVHRVTLTQSFWLGKMEVTQAQWQAVTGHNPSYFQGNDKPVESVSWDDCQAFLKRLNQLDRTQTYRLPTEAEWEFAARAARLGDTYEDPTPYAWGAQNSQEQTHAVGQKQPNPWGLYDMIGNVWEWCADGYGPYLPYPQKDPCAPSAELRSARGGSWLRPGGKHSQPGITANRVTLRYGLPPDFATFDVGFRVVAVPHPTPPD